MSVKDLIANWEEALAVALSQPDKRDAIELNDGDLEIVADRRIRSNMHAGQLQKGWHTFGQQSCCVPFVRTTCEGC